MSANPYIKNPLYVAQVNPKTGTNMAVYFFLGSVPKNVLAAANNGVPQADPRILKWNAKDAIILEKFYGRGWKKLLTAEDHTINESITDKKDLPLFFSYVGGAKQKVTSKQKRKKNNNETNNENSNENSNEDNNEDDNNEDGKEDKEDKEDIDNTDLEFFEKDNAIVDFFENEDSGESSELYENIKLFDESHSNISSNYMSTMSQTVKAPVYLPISVYPEDTIYDIKLKIYIATEIDFYRQHIFYYINGEGPATPYQFNVDNVPLYINYKDLYKKENILCNIYIDSLLEQRRDGIQIKAMDTFISLQITEGVRVNAIYFIDLYSVLAPVNYPNRPQDNLSQILKDKYSFDTLYYGAIIKYWPHLSIDILNTALLHPEKMGMHLLLSYNLKKIKERFELEKIIANLAINYNFDPNISIISATVHIFSKSARVRCLIRNIFDWVETDKTILMLNAKFDIESALLSESGMSLVSINERQGEFISITGLKRYITSKNPKYNEIAQWFLNNRVEGNTVMMAIMRKDSIRLPFIYLILYSNGEYKITGEWEEDDKINFNQIIEELSTITKPIIQKINSMGVAAFPSGGEYYIINNKSDAVLRYITGTILYPRYFSDVMFNTLKKKIKLLENANIIKIKNNQNPDMISFLFVKGIIAYNLKLADRAESANKKGNFLNQYAYLYNNIVFHRWTTSFSGRLVKIYHRATDIKIEINNADNINEFNLIKRYIYSYIDYIYTNNYKNEEKKTVMVSSKKRLKKLQENDPNLFDLKKYSATNKVYSVLCQSDRQPFSYTESEMKSFSENKRKKLIKYWNFTQSVPAYYECPHSKFPHLSFRPNQHPMGYCIPCCNMAKPPHNSKTAKMYEHCLLHKRGDIIKAEDISKHILSYGKYINVGRISEISKEIRDELFLGKLDKTNMLYLVGVEQFLPSVNDAGFTYSIIYLIKDPKQTIDDKIKELAFYAREMKTNFYQLGNGTGLLYKSSDDLADDILNIFIYKKEITAMVEKSGQIVSSWKLILIDLIKLIYNINIIIFTEEESSGEHSIECCGDFIFDNLIFILHNNNGFYPIISTNIKIFIKYLSNAQPTEDICIRQFDKGNKLYTTVQNIFTAMDNSLSIGPLLEIENAILSEKAYKITTLVINLRNFCYGVFISDKKNNEEFYFPINYSSYTFTDKYKILYDPIAEKHIPNLATVDAFIKKTNLDIVPEYNIINNKNTYIGFKSQNICYLVKEQNDPINPNIPNIIFPYSTLDINNDILKYVKNGNKIDTILNKYKSALMRNRLYKYFIAEFSSILMNDKNIEMRKKLIAILSETKFDSSNSLTTLRINLIKFLKNYPNDLIILKDIISKSFLMSSHNPLANIIKYVNSTYFEFDKQQLYNLKSLEHNALIKQLKILLSNNILISNEKNNETGNLYTSCSDPSSIFKTQCKNNKLIVSPDAIEDFYSILAMDIKNPTKTKMLTSLSAGIFDSMEFIHRENEILDIFIES